MSSSLKNPLLDGSGGGKGKLKSYGATFNTLDQHVDTFDDEIDIELQHSKPEIVVGSNFLRAAPSTDDFSDINWRDKNFANKVTRTGRQRKKLASRTKGGEFEAKRKKRRVNFLCLCSELDLEGLFDAVLNLDGNRWEVKIYEDVLHIFQQQANFNPQSSPDRQKSEGGSSKMTMTHQSTTKVSDDPSMLDDLLLLGSTMEVYHGPSTTLGGVGGTQPGLWKEPSMDFNDVPNATLLNPNHSSSILWSTGAKEVFIFEFGAIVFWGFRKGEEDALITLIRKFIEQGEVSTEEINEEGDDMGFVTSSETDVITIANDVITLPDNSSAKSRLSVSFAIAQSAVLSIFEGRVETKIKEFKYIPETLASNTDLRLTPKKLGKYSMILYACNFIYYMYFIFNIYTYLYVLAYSLQIYLLYMLY